MALLTLLSGTNANLIKEVSDFYVKDKSVVADVTYGRGAFWRHTDCSRFTLLRSDLKPKDINVVEMDFRCLSYANQSIDTLVLDPPYIHNPGVKKSHLMDKMYNNKETTAGMYHCDIIDMYAGGMREAKRVLKKSGQLWVKCKDEIEAGIQCESHSEIEEIGRMLGFRTKDLFILSTREPNPNRWKGKQRHARKNHSYLRIFELENRRYGEGKIGKTSASGRLPECLSGITRLRYSWKISTKEARKIFRREITGNLT